MGFWWEDSEAANAALEEIAKDIGSQTQDTCINSIDIAFADPRVREIINERMRNFEFPFYMRCFPPMQPGQTVVGIALRKMVPFPPIILPGAKLPGIFAYVDDKSSTVTEVNGNAVITFP